MLSCLYYYYTTRKYTPYIENTLSVLSGGRFLHSFSLIHITSHDILYTQAAKHTDSPHDLLHALSLAAVIIKNPCSFDAGPV